MRLTRLDGECATIPSDVRHCGKHAHFTICPDHLASANSQHRFAVMGQLNRTEFSGHISSGGGETHVPPPFIVYFERVCSGIVDNARLQKIFVIAKNRWHRFLKFLREAIMHSFARRRQVRSEGIIEALEEEIVSGSLAPGERIDEVALATRFGVSRTPIREALQVLCGRSLVEKLPYRGVVVAMIDPMRIDLMFEAMAEAEASCVRFASHRMTMSERAILVELHEHMTELLKSNDFSSYERDNVMFHNLLFNGCHNPELVVLANNIRLKLAPFRRYQLRDKVRVKRSSSEHNDIVTAILAQDSKAADAAVRRHLASAAHEVSSRLRRESASVHTNPQP